MLMKSISALITQVPHLATHFNLTTTTFSASTLQGHLRLTPLISLHPLTPCILDLLASLIHDLLASSLQGHLRLTPLISLHPPPPPFPHPLHTHFPSDWLTGRSLQAFIAPHSSSQLAALLHSARLPGHCAQCQAASVPHALDCCSSLYCPHRLSQPAVGSTLMLLV